MGERGRLGCPSNIAAPGLMRPGNEASADDTSLVAPMITLICNITLSKCKPQMEGALGKLVSSPNLTQSVVIEGLLDPEAKKISSRGWAYPERLCCTDERARGSDRLEFDLALPSISCDVWKYIHKFFDVLFKE